VPVFDRSVVNDFDVTHGNVDDLGDGLPYRGIVDVTNHVEVGSTQGPRQTRSVDWRCDE